MQEQRRWVGVLAVLGACCTSGFGGVYFELVLKPRTLNQENGDTPPRPPPTNPTAASLQRCPYPHPDRCLCRSRNAGPSPRSRCGRRWPKKRGASSCATDGLRFFCETSGAALGDQKRVATPWQAITDGADHIVVGRPIWQAADPAAAARANCVSNAPTCWQPLG